MTEKQLDKVVVHPLVLLSVTDHFTRVGKTGRVVGILLGKWTMGGTELDISNSFALPFDEDNKDSDIWFLDHDYLESMFTVSDCKFQFCIFLRRIRFYPEPVNIPVETFF